MSSPLPPPRGRPPLVPRPPAPAQASSPQPAPARPSRPAHSRHAASRLPTVSTRRGLPSGPRLADRRGLTATGGVVLLLLLCAGGAAYDLTTGPSLALGFTIGFLAGCVLVALLVHREDLRAAVVMPPLVYAGAAFFAGVIDPPAGTGSFVVRQGVAVLNELVLDAPVLFGGTAAAAVLVLLRWLGSRG